MREKLYLGIRTLRSGLGWFLSDLGLSGTRYLDPTKYFKFFGSDSGRFMSDLGQFGSIIHIPTKYPKFLGIFWVRIGSETIPRKITKFLPEDLNIPKILFKYPNYIFENLKFYLKT